MKKAGRVIVLTLIVILVMGWLAISGLSLYCSISYNCVESATGWWSLFITIIGIPIVVYQLYSLRDTIQKSVWKPVLDVGILVTPIDYDKVMKYSEIPKKLRFDLSYYQQFFKDEASVMKIQSNYKILFPIRMVLVNKGRHTAEHIKIQVTATKFPGETKPTLTIAGFELLPDGNTQVFRGGDGRITYPNDYDEFQITLARDLLELQRNQTSYWHRSGIDLTEMFQVGEYELDCIVWADGLDNILRKKLSIEIVNTAGIIRKIASSEQASPNLINRYQVE